MVTNDNKANLEFIEGNGEVFLRAKETIEEGVSLYVPYGNDYWCNEGETDLRGKCDEFIEQLGIIFLDPNGPYSTRFVMTKEKQACLENVIIL